MFKNLKIEVNGFKFFFDVSTLEHKKANEKEMNLEFLRALEIIGMQGSMIAVSSEEYRGMEDIYNLAVQIFGGGGDLKGD